MHHRVRFWLRKDKTTTRNNISTRAAHPDANDDAEMSPPGPRTFPPVIAQFGGENLIVGGGVAIFHVKSGRVVICSAVGTRSGERYFFLPKGRRDAGEESGVGAEREGFEESGYRNRLLPLPTAHMQPQAHPRTHALPLTAEPVWMQLMPLRHLQYVLYWYIAETLPPALEAELETPAGHAYKPPPAYPRGLSLAERVKQEPEGYEPVHHEGTGVDEEERTYESFLVPVEEAVSKLGKNGVMADVVLRGWKGIQDRFAMEAGELMESPEEIM